MAVIKAETAQGFSGLPVLRQLGLMIGLAASVALGVAVVMWSQEPSYTLLYGNLSGTDSSQVLDVLQKSSIPYKVEEGSGAIMVASEKIHDARLKLASEGLPKGNGVGFELFDKEQELGTSKFVEQARYQHAVEIELARSIKTIRGVKNARIHLAIPKRSVFVRKKDKPTASVVLDLYSGYELSDGQIASVVHMVASSVPALVPENVTVVDQSGKLLSSVSKNDMMAMSSSQFEFTRKLEENYKRRIEDLISPIVGPGRVRAQVVADMDYTMTEKTRESYNPDLPALRSEQVVKESSDSATGGASGVPGALSNQPPAEGSASTTNGTGSSRTNSRTTRNYELDKTISHTRTSPGKIRKLSVAVLVDDLQKVDEEGNVTRAPLNDAALTRLQALVKEAVGYSSDRGDSVNVINASFYVPEKPEALPEEGLFEKPWVHNVIKQALGGLVVLILIFGVLRPVMRSLTDKGAASNSGNNAGSAMNADFADDTVQISGGGGVPQLAAPNQIEDKLQAAKTMVNQDPGQVAQVVKTWVANDV